MSFSDVLQGIIDRVEGAQAVSLIGLDGIAVESLNRAGIPLDAVGAEFGGFVRAIRMSDKELNTGEVLQISIVAERMIVFLSAITPEYYVLLVLAPGGNYGRARFELTRAKQLLRHELV